MLEDGGGDRASVAAADVGNDALAYPLVPAPPDRGPRDHPPDAVPALGTFTGVDLDDIVAVEFAFDRTASA